jgi:hypothetical protein
MGAHVLFDGSACSVRCIEQSLFDGRTSGPILSYLLGSLLLIVGRKEPRRPGAGTQTKGGRQWLELGNPSVADVISTGIVVAEIYGDLPCAVSGRYIVRNGFLVVSAFVRSHHVAKAGRARHQRRVDGLALPRGRSIASSMNRQNA